MFYTRLAEATSKNLPELTACTYTHTARRHRALQAHKVYVAHHQSDRNIRNYLTPPSFPIAAYSSKMTKLSNWSGTWFQAICLLLLNILRYSTRILSLSQMRVGQEDLNKVNSRTPAILHYRRTAVAQLIHHHHQTAAYVQFLPMQLCCIQYTPVQN